MNNEDNWKQKKQFYQEIIEKEQKHMQNYLIAIKDQIKKGIFCEYQVIVWGQEVKKIRTMINFHKVLLEKFKKDETE